MFKIILLLLYIGSRPVNLFSQILVRIKKQLLDDDQGTSIRWLMMIIVPEKNPPQEEAAMPMESIQLMIGSQVPPLK